MRTATKHLYEFGPFRLDTYRRVLLRDGQIVALTPKVLDLLTVLVENSGHVVPKDELLSEVWPDTVVDEGNINRNISTLRRALPDVGADYIETVPKRGYRFAGEVREVDASVVLERVTRARVTIEEESDRRAVWPLVTGSASSMRMVTVPGMVTLMGFSS